MLSAMAGYIQVGDPFEQTTTMGPVISEPAMNRILGMVERGVSAGGRLITGGERMGGDHGEGYYLPITILADVPNVSEIAQNEVFGPVLVVTPFDTEEEAIALANGTPYGLGAYVHTQNLRRAHHVTSQLDAGQINVNGAGEAMQPNVPFGGFKQSGHGRLGGVEGLHDFLQPKNIWMNLAAPEDAK
jgi:acyl-CoA reductase-like NAD-dependent aldehyde dehydrogenase